MMAVYKVLQSFRDKNTKKVYEEGQEIEMTVKRADEASANLKKWDGEFLERIDKQNSQIDNPKDDDPANEGNEDDSEGGE